MRSTIGGVTCAAGSEINSGPVGAAEISGIFISSAVNRTCSSVREKRPRTTTTRSSVSESAY